jgi:hypothetical protein
LASLPALFIDSIQVFRGVVGDAVDSASGEGTFVSSGGFPLLVGTRDGDKVPVSQLNDDPNVTFVAKIVPEPATAILWITGFLSVAILLAARRARAWR